MADEPAAEPRGVFNPRVVDLVSWDAEREEVLLTMLEVRPWESDEEQLRQLEDKFNAYLSYVLDGHMVQQYPEYEGCRVRFELECASSPREDERPFLTAMGNFAAAEQIEFVVTVTADGGAARPVLDS